MTREMTCIVCPKGCTLRVSENDGGIAVKGALCSRGEEYGVSEVTNPMRTLQTTIRTEFPGYRRVAVKTSGEIPLKEIFLYMDEIKKQVLTEKLQVGQIVSSNLLDSGVDLILTERLY